MSGFFVLSKFQRNIFAILLICFVFLSCAGPRNGGAEKRESSTKLEPKMTVEPKMTGDLVQELTEDSVPETTAELELIAEPEAVLPVDVEIESLTDSLVENEPAQEMILDTNQKSGELNDSKNKKIKAGFVAEDVDPLEEFIQDCLQIPTANFYAVSFVAGNVTLQRPVISQGPLTDFFEQAYAKLDKVPETGFSKDYVIVEPCDEREGFVEFLYQRCKSEGSWDKDCSYAQNMEMILSQICYLNSDMYKGTQIAPLIDVDLVEYLTHNGRYDEAQGLRLEIIKRYDHNSSWFMRNQKYPAAVANAENAIRVAMFDASRYYQVSAEIFTKENFPKKGSELYESAIEGYEAYLNQYEKQTGWYDYAVHSFLAQAYVAKGQKENAARMFHWIANADTTGYGICPASIDSYYSKEDALYNEAAIHYEADEYETAVALLRNFVEIFPNHEYNLYVRDMLARSLYELGMYKESLREYHWLFIQYANVEASKNDSIAHEIQTAIIKIRSVMPHEYMVDSRDGKKYRTTEIDGQIWMAENLNYQTKNSVCYGNKKSNCFKYGRLYDWDEAKMACPEGWHLPSALDFEHLLEIDSEKTFKHIKSETGWKKHNGNNMTGFASIPSGCYYSIRHVQNFGDLGRGACYWSSSEHAEDGRAYSLGVNDDYADVPGALIKDGYSVRCIKDNDVEPLEQKYPINRIQKKDNVRLYR